MGNHKRNHNYHLMDNGTFALICEDWTADEELLLLDAIEQHGLGNWDDIADHIGTKGPQEAQFHFEETYLWKNIGKVTLPRVPSDIPDHTTINGRLSPSLTNPPEPIDLPVLEQQELGYMPYRDDFEREYENDSESLLRNLVCNRDDDELETALKLSHADMYWRVLKERNRWKTVGRQYGLIASKHKLIASRRKLSREDREFKDKIRVFAQMLPPQQWEELINNRIREKEMKLKIKELVRYRRNGIKKMAACQDYEEQKLQREKKKENKKRMQVISPPRTTKTSGNKTEKEQEEEKPVIDHNGAISVQSDVANFKERMKSDPCFQLMSDKEKQLCSSIQLKCSRYLTLKTFILNEYSVRRYGGQFKSRVPPYLTPVLKKTLKEFFAQCGWINE